MAVYTLRRRSTGETAQTTDPGQAIRNGQWAGPNRFKTPNIRGLAARAPYFHNGIAADLPALVTFYERSLGFDFTPDEEAGPGRVPQRALSGRPAAGGQLGLQAVLAHLPAEGDSIHTQRAGGLSPAFPHSLEAIGE